MRFIKLNLFSILIITMLVSACSPVAPAAINPTSLAMTQSGDVIEITPLPTETPTVEFLAPTFESTVLPSDITPIVIEQPTPETTLAVEPALTNKKFPPALIQIENPGPLSRLASPFLVKANVYPGDQGLVNIQLIGEDGRLMSDQLLKMDIPESGWVSLAVKIPFEISSGGEAATLVVVTRDGYERRIAQSSVPILLMQIGKSEIENPGFLKLPFVITLPVAGGTSRKGTLHVEGFVHPFNKNPLIVELVTQTGGILTSTVIPLPRIAEGQDFTQFSADLTYTVSKQTPVRLTIRQQSEKRQDIDVALVSQIIYLQP
jgi:hypothetical protein